MKPVIIAEFCQNHNGRWELVERMVDAAAASGADYAKLQTIRSEELTHRPRFDTGAFYPDGRVKVIKRPYEPELKRLSALDLSLEQEAKFIELCKRAGIKSMTTVFTRAGARDVRDLGYDAIKIASYDCASYPLLRDVKQLGRPLFVSTGATFDEEIERAAAVLDGADYEFLHCVTIYPTPLEEVHLRRMEWLRRFTPRVGFSDHSKPSETGLWASKAALAFGASCIERHFTVLPPEATRDGPVSVNPEQLQELKAFAERPKEERLEILKREFPNWEMMLGDAHRPLSETELLNRDYYRGRFASKVGGRVIYNWEEDEIFS